jgi:gliding motility-associated lipoprotein GldH
MVNLRNNLLYLLVAKVLFFSGCNSGVAYNETVEFSSEGWHKDNSTVFTAEITDTTKVFDIGLTFKHNDDYPYSNLWLFLTVTGPGELNVRDTLELFLAEPDGRWLGRKRGGSLEISALYQHDVKMAQPGAYTFRVVHGMRRALLPDIESVEFWIQSGK